VIVASAALLPLVAGRAPGEFGRAARLQDPAGTV